MKPPAYWTAAATRLVPLAEPKRIVRYQAAGAPERWQQVIEKDAGLLKEVCSSMKEMLSHHGISIPVWIISTLAYHLHYARHGYFIDESDEFARHGGISRALMAFLQRQYTWSHMACTTASLFDPAAREMVMLRSLDWPGAETLARATRLHEFQDASGRAVFLSAGLTGMVGLLTAVKPGAFSIALNFAHARRSIRPAADPTMMIRRLLEDAKVDSFGAAKLAISRWDLGAPCFISLCGIEKGEGCVFEFLRGGAHEIREMGDAPYVVQANHYDGQEDTAATALMEASDTEARFQATLAQSSGMRRRQVETRFAEWGADPRGEPIEAAALRIWSEVPVRNYETTQFVVMRPSTGAMNIWVAARA
jgi:hypothetical protein